MQQRPEKIRLGLILKREFVEQDRFTSVLTSRLLGEMFNRFNCELITNQKELCRHYDDVDVLLSFEPKFAAPLVNWRGGFCGFGRRRPKLSYVMCSDAHMRKWRQGYFLDNQISFMLVFYYAPFRHHFRRIPQHRLVHFPWSVPDQCFNDQPIVCRHQDTLCCFGASQGDAYNVRNWCKSFDFVKAFSFSGVENKQMSNESYFEWLRGFDVIIAAGSDIPKFDLTTPKYFEAAAAGALLFAQRTKDLEILGFRHMENCVIFDKDTFEDEARKYFRHPENYLGIREAGRRMARQKHSLAVRLDFLEKHIRSHQ